MADNIPLADMQLDLSQDKAVEDIKESESAGDYGWLGIMIVVGMIYTFTLFITLFMLVASHDYFLQQIYDVASTLNASGSLSNAIMASIDTISTTYTQIFGFIDWAFFISFMILIIGLIRESYFMKRRGYFTLLSYITIGLMVVLFITSIIYQIMVWFKGNFMDSLFPSIMSSMNFYNFYFNHYGIINLAVLIICIIVNFADLDFSKYRSRKIKETESDEL